MVLSSSIEKNKLDNIDLLQIEYFSELSVSNKDIIVIEPNNPIAIAIRKFLIDLGFENILVCKKTEEGLQIFADFIGNEISIPIIIDDSIPYKNLKNMIEETLELQPSAKILVMTAKEKTDTHITKLFDIGISAIISKPLNFAEVEETMSYIFEKNEKKQEKSLEEKLDILLASNSIISEQRIRNITDGDESKLEEWIKKAKQNQKIVMDKEILQATCNQCKSSNITYSSKCPSCKQINIKQEILIEHYSCGEVYQKEPGSNICPKCNKSIGSVGKDYLENTDFYRCNSCNDKFPRPFLELICLNCSNVFVESAIQWKKDTLYKIKRQ